MAPDTTRAGGIFLGNEESIVRALDIGSASEVIVSQAKRRKLFYARNVSLGAQKITIVLSNDIAAVADIGIVLKVGESFADSNTEGYKAWSGKIRAIASVPGGILTTTEISEDINN